jgi:ribosome assembly protein 1
MAADADAEQQGGEGLPAVLERAWMLGPKRTGPNLLLASSSSTGPGSLFDLPPDRVVKLSKQQLGRGAAPLPGRQQQQQHQQQRGEEEEEEEEHAEMEAARRRLAVPLGYPEAAQKLGLVEGSDQAGQHASSAVADLASQLDRHLSVSMQTEAPAAPEANGSSSSGGGGGGEGLGQSLEYLRASIESGVASGFQLASAAGPLCDEPLWGTVVRVEGRLNLAPAAAEGGSCPEAACLQLAEDVYGPFSGQVTSVARQAVRRAVMEGDPRLVEAMFLCEVRGSCREAAQPSQSPLLLSLGPGWGGMPGAGWA